MPDGRPVDDVAAGRAALSVGDWIAAHARFSAALAASESPSAFEGLSWAAWWLDDGHACIAARTHAYHGYRDVGDERSAARMALWLGDDHVEFLGAHAVAHGWFARAARLLDALDPCPEHGWLAVFEAHDALGRGDLDDAWDRAQQARDLGGRLRELDLEMFAVATEGVVRIERGEITAGRACLDEAAAAAVAGEFDNLAPAAWSCCLVMSTCERVRDYERGAQWCREIEMFGERIQARFLRGVCRAHLGAVHAWHGSWARAERELVEALAELADNRPAWWPEAAVRLGQLRLRQGRLDDAEQLFEQAPDHPSAPIGMAAVSLERDDVVTARDLIDRSLRQAGADGPAGRVDAVELRVRVELAAGDPAAARPWLDELRAAAERLGAEPLAATVRECEGLIAAAELDHDAACDYLEDAIDAFVALNAPVEAARVRLALASSLAELGRPEAAGREARRALDDLRDVDAALHCARAEAFLAQIDAGDRHASGRDGSLTDRQVDVLRLVADGLSDRQIADRLVLSPHTVHRHVANIYTRLGCSSRAAAVAEAGRRGLL